MKIIGLVKIIDVVMVPLVFFAALLLKKIRTLGVDKFPLSKMMLMKVGVFPVTNHYYEPQFDIRELKWPLDVERNLPGINWRYEEQLSLCKSLVFSDELKNIPMQRTANIEFHFNNSFFESGDAEFWYQIIRLKKPRKIIEIGSGSSTLMAQKAINQNKYDDPDYTCSHVCIEPHERPWLEEVGVTVIRSLVEDIDLSFFSQLEKNDILFIDSSHVIRPQGDVLFEYLQLLPELNQGVIVHIHDIFSPRNYPKDWLSSRVLFWNEQYLLEAFLTHNESWKIIGALNYLHHNSYEELHGVCPYLVPEREPGSFYIQKVS
ncbi:class I SAM-dependent methyltransferase [Kiloniella sp.]|uniref:class I SAM-dependent methyltransferase n=1 Tax=Kiloniella sp. TaxID=1938587 RepID=UPI003A915CB0